ncbi:hypothetical protein LUZ60_011556 [Juncus effusus]|nr:hypothetical protein LUZ60_011556 [Juncus effusus]
MFFSGDPSARKRVDLGGRSSKERDRKVLLEQARLERKRRQGLRQQTTAATKIQKCYRGRKEVEKTRLKVREQFILTYGTHCQKVNWQCFGPESSFLRELLFFVNVNKSDDVSILLEASRLILNYAQQFGNISNLFGGNEYSSQQALVQHRVKKLTYLCLRAIYHNRTKWKDQVLMQSNYSTMPTIILLETISCLIDYKSPWSCKVVGFLHEKKVFCLLKDVLLAGLVEVKRPISPNKKTQSSSSSSLERVIIVISSHFGSGSCSCANLYPDSSFYSQILSIPFLWHHLPYLKEAFCMNGLGAHYIHEMARFLPRQNNNILISNNVGPAYPWFACVLANLLESASYVLSDPKSSHDVVIDTVHLLTFLLDMLPPLNSPSTQNLVDLEDEDEPMEEEGKEELDADLRRDICSSVDSGLLQKLVNTLFKNRTDLDESSTVGSACAFLHSLFTTLPMERILTVLAYRTEIVPAIWSFIKRCHSSDNWPVFAKLGFDSSDVLPGWLLPLTVFSPIYKHMLTIIDNEEFYEQEKPLSVNDIKSLILILKQALWNLLWTMPTSHNNNNKVADNSSGFKKLSIENFKSRGKIVISDLLAKLQDWNNRRQFTSSTDFHYQEAMNENFISQSMSENSKANETLKLAPFLVPFNARVRIFQSHLDASKASSSHSAMSSHRLKIRRNRILEDAFSQLSSFSEEDLRTSIRIVYVNELGVEEAGIDGGGIFKDFMENIVQASFDVQYGLFKETSDHQLYPNPGSGLIHEQHLHYFHFLGSLLGKAMYEGILVDIPLATFFLSKLKQKYNYLNDLPSLDPELYRHLQFLKHYKGAISELELYFVVVNNEYGEQIEEELLPGGKEKRVTNENVITFIHLVANHHLNYQIRHQSLHFLRGFQQLIQKDWIDMFNEHELQLLISGSLESMDVDDLRTHATYSGGYRSDHEVIEMFWEVLKSFSVEHRKKFLKFVTGCSRGPLLGFKYLEPKFCIQRVGPVNLNDEFLNRLPTSATCMNLLKLPPYTSKELMRTKLMYAINAEAGFDLS